MAPSLQSLHRPGTCRLRVAAAGRRVRGILRVQASAAPATLSASTSEHLELGWQTNIRDHYASGPVLGVGSFGTVYQGVHHATGELVAVKQLPKERPKLARAKVLEKLQREVTWLDRLTGCPHAVQLLECFEDEANVYLVTEACLGGDLHRFSDTYGPLTERCLALVAKEILEIVKACHRLGIVHGDVKPANFCIVDEYRHPYAASLSALQRTPWLKAIDFGCSQLHHKHTRLSKRSGTPVFMAPEIFRRDYSFEVDMWSTGVTLYQLFCRRFPFWDGESYSRALSLDEVAKAVTEADIRLDFGPWLTMSPEGIEFIRSCLERDPAKRLTVEDAMSHPWIQKQAAEVAPAVPGQLVQEPALVTVRRPAPPPQLHVRKSAAMAA